VREIMAEQTRWTGNASDLLRGGADALGENAWRGRAGWPTSPRALAGRLRRAQTSLRTAALGPPRPSLRRRGSKPSLNSGAGRWALRLPSREGRAGTRIIRISASPENPQRQTVSTVGNVVDDGRSEWGHLSPDAEFVDQAR
jgi:hypothetical protein